MLAGALAGFALVGRALGAASTGFAELADLVGGQVAPTADVEVHDADGANGDADQLERREARLSRAQQVTRTSETEICLGDVKAIGGLFEYGELFAG